VLRCGGVAGPSSASSALVRRGECGDAFHEQTAIVEVPRKGRAHGCEAYPVASRHGMVPGRAHVRQLQVDLGQHGRRHGA
jgi:hypothetical protein